MIKYLTIFLLFPLSVFATAVPVDNFEGYSVGDLQAQGSGVDDSNQCNWTEAWGATATCDASVNVQTGTVKTGTNAIEYTAGTGSCTRDFDAMSTANAVLTVHMRAAQTNIRMDYNWQTTGAQIVQFGFGDDGNLRSLNNGTWNNIQAYSANTWYQFDNRVSSFAGKTFNSRIDLGTWTGDLTFANNSAATELIRFAGDSSNATFFFDELGIGGGENSCPVAATDQPADLDDNWGTILKREMNNFLAYARNN